MPLGGSVFPQCLSRSPQANVPLVKLQFGHNKNDAALRLCRSCIASGDVHWSAAIIQHVFTLKNRQQL